MEKELSIEEQISELEKQIQEEIDNADDTIIKNWYAEGKGIYYVKLLRTNHSEALKRGYHTKYFTGTQKEYLKWSNELSNKCHDEFKLIDCGEIKKKNNHD